MTAPRLLLDVMGTLVYDPFYREVPDVLGVPFDELLRLKHPTAWAEFERGEIDEESFYARFFEDGRALDGPAMKRAMIESYRWLDGMEALVEGLAKGGYELHLFSNYPSWWRHVEERVGLSAHAEWTFVSCDYGVRKPSERAFEAILEAIGAAPRECVFVDDTSANCRRARTLGIDAIEFTGAEPLQAELAKRGILPC